MTDDQQREAVAQLVYDTVVRAMREGVPLTTADGTAASWAYETSDALAALAPVQPGALRHPLPADPSYTPSVGDMRARHAAGMHALGYVEDPAIDAQFDAFLAARSSQPAPSVTAEQVYEAALTADESSVPGSGDWTRDFLAALGIRVQP